MVRELTQLNTLQQRLIAGLFMLVVLFALAYVYAVHRTVYNVVIRGERQTNIDEFRSRVAALEFEYIDRKNVITREYAAALGYREPENPLFVSRDNSEITLRSELKDF